MKFVPESEAMNAYRQTTKPHHTCNNVACSYFVRTLWLPCQSQPSGGCGHYSGQPCDSKKHKDLCFSDCKEGQCSCINNDNDSTYKAITPNE